VDAEFAAGDVRLTMGGEPTFVSTHRFATPKSGNTAALVGPTKRARAVDLLRRLKRRYGANGFLHFGQASGIPANRCHGGRSVAIGARTAKRRGRTRASFADESKPDGHNAAERQAVFIAALAAQLGVTADHVLAGYEDVWYYLWRRAKAAGERRPVLDARLDDELERDRLRRLLHRAWTSPPVTSCRFGGRAGQKDVGRRRAGFLRDDRLYLVPGDSPMGLRLPLDSLQVVGAWRSPHGR